MLDPVGPVPRLGVTRSCRTLNTVAGAVPLNLTATTGTVVELPAAHPRVVLVVARAVAETAVDRTDLVFPDDLVRDDAGNVLACRALGVLCPSGPDSPGPAPVRARWTTARPRQPTDRRNVEPARHPRRSPGGLQGVNGHPPVGAPRYPWMIDLVPAGGRCRSYVEVSLVEPDPVVVVEVSDDANEDRWADAFWRAEDAARAAAVAAGADPQNLVVERDHRGSVTVRGRDGRAFRAVVRSRAAMHRVELPRLTEPQ